MNHTYTYEESIRKIFLSGNKSEFKRRSLILRPGEIPAGIYYIESGFVEMYTADSSRGKSLHIIFKKGELFPVAWIINRIRRNVSYRAMSNCTLYSIPRPEVLSMMQENAQLAIHILQQVTEQFTLFADRIDNLEYKYASDRLAYRLIFLASRFGEKRGDDIIIRAPLTHQAIGDSINLSRESVSRELEKLIHKGVIAYSNRTIIIKDLVTLRKTFKQPLSPDWWGLSDSLPTEHGSQFIG